MGDSLVTVVAIILAAVLIFVFPVMAMANRQDSTIKSDIQAKVDEFVNDVRTTGKLTEDKYYKFLDNISATGNVYNVEMEFKILDQNPGKKAIQTETDKIGENIYYSDFTDQIISKLESASKEYDLKEGDIVTITVKNTNLTVAQQLANHVYNFFGNDTYTIMATGGGMVVTTAK